MGRFSSTPGFRVTHQDMCNSQNNASISVYFFFFQSVCFFQWIHQCLVSFGWFLLLLLPSSFWQLGHHSRKQWNNLWLCSAVLATLWLHGKEKILLEVFVSIFAIWEIVESMQFQHFFQICMLFSACYHLFCCHSERVFHLWLSLDLAGISLGLCACYIPALYYAFYCHKVKFAQNNLWW